MKIWFILKEGEKIGPLTKAEVRASGPDAETMVFAEGMEDWKPLVEVEELQDIVKTDSHEVIDKVDNVLEGVFGNYGEKKSKKLTGLFCIFGGLHGMHYAYLGKTKAAVYSLCAMLICVVLIFPAILLPFWCLFNLVQGIIILCMKDEKFEEKFVNTSKTFPTIF